MKIRTFFWHARIISKREFAVRKLLRRRPYHHFLVGNAGDLLTADLILRQYRCGSINDATRGGRLLLAGSISHCILDGDVVCGVGTKGRPIPPARTTRIHVRAVRGPITLQALREAGHDVSRVRFLLDPGLMVRFMIGPGEREIEPRGVIFIPHYRERALYVKRGALPSGMRLVDIDDWPMNVVRQILGAKLVYTSSLHGIIFAHAVGRPCVLVRPQTDEGLLKYEDYFASVNLPMPRPLPEIWASLNRRSPDSPAELNYKSETFALPTIDELSKLGVTAP